MNAGGWIVMALSVGGTTGLLAWCLLRVLRAPGREQLHSQADIEPPDVER